jgi:hypothetical protein
MVIFKTDSVCSFTCNTITNHHFPLQNSFEQLCINLANEALQQHFNYNIFQFEIDTYTREDVPVPPLEYKDNQDVLDLIIKKPKVGLWCDCCVICVCFVVS